MGLFDIIILVMLIVWFMKGFKIGMFSQLVTFLGLLVVVFLSFILKNYLSMFFYNSFPFLSIGGIFKGIESINILFYEFLAFIVVFAILFVVFRVVLYASNILDKVINFTIILTLPAKLIGGILGVLEGFVYVFILVLILNLPNVSNDFIRENCKYGDFILTNTPFLSSIGEQIVEVSNEVISIKDKYVNSNNSDQINLEVIEVLLDKKIVSVANVELLVNRGKLDFVGIEELLNKYTERGE